MSVNIPNWSIPRAPGVFQQTSQLCLMLSPQKLRTFGSRPASTVEMVTCVLSSTSTGIAGASARSSSREGECQTDTP